MHAQNTAKMSTAASKHAPPRRNTAKGENYRRQTNIARPQNQTGDDILDPCSIESGWLVIVTIANFTTNFSVDKLYPPHLAELRTTAVHPFSAFGFRIS
jgi:hypothetical protein